MTTTAPPPAERSHAVSRAVYRALLRLYPHGFRRRFASDLEHDFVALLDDQAARGALRGRVAAWRLVIADLAASIPRERLRYRRAARAQSRSSERRPMSSLVFDLRHAVRALRRTPLFAAVTIAIFAIGIAANTATFSLVRHILLRPLPFVEPDRLLFVYEALPQAGIEKFAFSAPDLLDFEEYQRAFEGVGAFSTREVELSGDDEPERLLAGRVTPNLFELLGVSPALGRSFTAEDDRPGSDVAILDFGFWQERFGASADVLGRTISVDRRPVTVIGVMPESFTFPLERMPFHDRPAQFFVPTAFTEYERRARGSMHNHVAVVPLADGVSIDEARSDLGRVAGMIHANYPPVLRENYDLELFAHPLRDDVVGAVERPLLMLLAAMGLVLLVICANVANLTLARAAGRRPELALRAAMGAGRTRLAQVMLLESLLLAGAGGALAVLLARVVVSGVAARLGGALPMSSRVELDAGVLVFTVATTLVAAAISGLLPLFASGRSLESVLREGSTKSTAAHGTVRLQRTLVVATVALAVVLLVGSGLLVRSFLRLTATDAGFHEREVLTMGVTLPTSAYPEPDRVRAFLERLQERLEALPGVERASLGTALPMSVGEIRAVAAEHPLDPTLRQSVAVTWSTGPYYETLGIPIRRGRAFLASDRADTALVALVSESLARQLWGSGEPVGQRIKWGVDAESGAPWMEVVGVVGDVHDGPLGSEPQPHVYVPYLQLDDSELDAGVAVGSAWGRAFYLALLADGDPTRLTGAAIAALHELDASLPVTDIETMAQVVARGVAPQRLSMAVVSAFGGVALVLAAIGLYGMLAFGVARRAREIGLRLALGADRASLVTAVLRDGLLLVGGGVALGLLGAAALVRLLPTVLFETDVHDPWVFAAAPGVLLLAALAACLLPAVRASRVDPMSALRVE